MSAEAHLRAKADAGEVDALPERGGVGEYLIRHHCLLKHPHPALPGKRRGCAGKIYSSRKKCLQRRQSAAPHTACATKSFIHHDKL